MKGKVGRRDLRGGKGGGGGFCMECGEGSFTVEASLIMPLILMVTVMVIYLSFFLYDRCLISQQVYISALKGSRSEEGKRMSELMVIGEFKEKLEGRMIPKQDLFVSCDSGRRGVRVCVKTGVAMPFPGFAAVFSGAGGWDIEVERSVSEVSGVSFIRSYKKIESTIK